MPQHEDAAAYAYAVESDVRWLLRKLADPDADAAYAVEALGSTAARVLGGAVRRFAPDLAEPVTEQDELDILGMTVAELNVAATVLAASRATTFGAGPAERADLERAAASLSACRLDLERDRAMATTATAFAPRAEHSPDPPTAARRLRDEADQTLDSLAVRVSGAVRQAARTVAGCPSGQLGQALANLRDLDTLAEKVRPVEKKLRGLAELALRLVTQALTRLSRVLPAGCLDDACARVGRLTASFGTSVPGSMTAEVLGIPGVRQEIAARFASAEPERWDTKLLDGGTADLTALAHRFESVMAAASAVLAGTVVAGDALGWIPLAMEVRPAIVASVALAVLAFVVVTGRDFAGSGSVFTRVRSVRHVVAVACGEGT